MQTVGFIGLGNLGTPMARNIQRAGFPMVVFDVVEGATKPLLEGGARFAASPREVAAASEVILSSVPGPPEVEQVALGPEGIVSGIGEGDVYVDLSTSRAFPHTRDRERLRSEGRPRARRPGTDRSGRR